MKLIRWETPISDCKDLYFKRLVDKGQAFFEVEGDGQLYEIVLGSDCGPYIIADEEFLGKYWNIKEKQLGRTFVVEKTDLPEYFSIERDVEDYKHYVVGTWDTCLEILAKSPPPIRRVK